MKMRWKFYFINIIIFLILVLIQKLSIKFNLKLYLLKLYNLFGIRSVLKFFVPSFFMSILRRSSFSLSFLPRHIIENICCTRSFCTRVIIKTRQMIMIKIIHSYYTNVNFNEQLAWKLN